MSDGILPSIEEIQSKTEIPVFVVEGRMVNMEGPAIIGNNQLEDVLDFADAIDAKVVLVEFDYPDLCEYIVDPDIFDLEEMFEEDDLNDILDEIEERNDSLMKFFDEEYDDEPIGCSIFVEYNGAQFGVYIEDYDVLARFGETCREFYARIFFDDDEDVEEDEELRLETTIQSLTLLG